MRIYNIYKLFLCWICCATCCLIACDPEIESIGEDPYAGGREPLGITLSNKMPTPEMAYPGEKVIFGAKGLLAWAKPEQGKYDFEFFIAGEKVEIETVTDSTITIIVPQNVSSGGTHILLNGQVFYGPNFNVAGNVRVDLDWGLKEGTNGVIFNYLEHSTQARSYYFLGGFNSVGLEPRTKLMYVSNRGELAGPATSRYNVRLPLRENIINEDGIVEMSQETLSSMAYFNDGQVLLSGFFNAYVIDQWDSGYTTVNNITILNNDLSLDTMHVNVRQLGQLNTVTRIVPRFNGGTLQPIIRSFVTQDGAVIAVGNISTYAQVDYSQSSNVENIYIYKNVASAIRMERNGNLDLGYRSGNQTGADGSITDAYMGKDDNVVIVGGFTTFDGIVANRIVRLGSDGRVDQTYMDNIGMGANGTISMVRYNKNLGKAVVVGNFTTFNGQPRQGIAVLHEDGRLDNTFVPREIAGGNINFGSLLNSGKVVISGSFQRYNGVTRPGFLILDEDGGVTQLLNVFGTFVGQLYQVVETQSSRGLNGLLLMGNFSRFNGEQANNIVMLDVDFD